MNETAGWGILGTGKIARILAQAITSSTTGELVAVGSRTPARATEFAEEFRAGRGYDGYEAVIEDPAVDIVYVATIHPTHLEWAVKAADAGKHVLCEKPLAMDEDEAGRIVEAARRNGVFLMEAFAYRCHPQTRRLVEILGSGSIGEIRFIDAVFGYDAGPRPGNYVLVRELGGGSILDVGCYTTSMAHLIAGIGVDGSVADTAGVAGAAHIGTSTGVDHTAAATLTFPGDLIARVACSVQVDLGSSLRINGSEGRVTLASPWFPGTRSEIVVERGNEREVLEVEAGADAYTIEVDAVGKFVLEGQSSPSVMSWEESLANMRTLDRWRESIGLTYEAERHLEFSEGTWRR